MAFLALKRKAQPCLLRLHVLVKLQVTFLPCRLNVLLLRDFLNMAMFLCQIVCALAIEGKTEHYKSSIKV